MEPISERVNLYFVSKMLVYLELSLGSRWRRVYTLELVSLSKKF